MTGLRDVRVGPHNDDAERSVLGSVLMDNDVLDEVSSLLTPESFFREVHRHVFSAMLTMRERRQRIDVLTLADALKTAGLLDEVGGANFLARLSRDVPSTANVGDYAAIVRRKATLRDTADAYYQLAAAASADPEDFDEFMAGAEATTQRLTTGATRVEYRHIRDGIREAVADLERAEKDGKKAGVVETGLLAFDELIGGFGEGEYIALGARPGTGKSALAQQLATAVALEKEVAVGIISLEMRAKQCAQRILSNTARVDAGLIAEGRLSSVEWQRYVDAAGRLMHAPIFIGDAGSLDLASLSAMIRRMVSQDGVRVVVFDYLQLIQIRGRESRRDGLGRASRAIKQLAMDLGITIVVIVQLNRDCEKRQDSRPIMADIREVGDVENDADVVAFLHREAIDEADDSKTPFPDLAELITRKRRGGAIGTSLMRWFGEYVRFEDTRRDSEGRCTRRQEWETWRSGGRSQGGREGFYR